MRFLLFSLIGSWIAGCATASQPRCELRAVRAVAVPAAHIDDGYQKASFRGSVVDCDGAPLSNAGIELKAPWLQGWFLVRAGADGTFEQQVPSGTYLAAVYRRCGQTTMKSPCGNEDGALVFDLVVIAPGTNDVFFHGGDRSIPASLPARDGLVWFLGELLDQKPACAFDKFLTDRLGPNRDDICKLAGAEVVEVRQSKSKPASAEVTVRAAGTHKDSFIVLSFVSRGWRVESVWFLDSANPTTIQR